MQTIENTMEYLDLLGYRFDWDTVEPEQVLNEWESRREIAHEAGMLPRTWQEYFAAFEGGLVDIGQDLAGLDEDLARLEEEMSLCVRDERYRETDEGYDGEEKSVADSDESGYELSECDGICESSLVAGQTQRPSESPIRTTPVSSISLDVLSQQTDMLVSSLSTGKHTFDWLHSLTVNLIHDMNAHASGMIARNERDKECRLLTNMGRNMNRVVAKLDLWEDTPEELKDLLNLDLQRAYSGLYNALDDHVCQKNDDEHSLLDTNACDHQFNEIRDTSAPVSPRDSFTEFSANSTAMQHITLEALSQETRLLREEVMEQPNALESIYDRACTTLNLLETSLDGLSSDVAAFSQTGAAQKPERKSVHSLTIEIGSDKEVKQLSDPDVEVIIASGEPPTAEVYPATTKTLDGVETLLEQDPSSEQAWWNKNDNLEPTENRDHKRMYLRMLLPAGFTVLTRSAFHASLTYTHPSTCLYFPDGTDGDYIERVMRLESGVPRRKPCSQVFEDEKRQWLKEAIELEWAETGHTIQDPQIWKEFETGGGHLLLLSRADPVLRPCGNRLLLELKHVDPDTRYETIQRSGKTHSTVVPNFYHKLMQATSCKKAGSKSDGFYYYKTFLPAGFTIPAGVEHAGCPTLSNAAFVYDFPTGMGFESLYGLLRGESEYGAIEVAITSIESSNIKRQLQDAIETWWITMGVEAKYMNDWHGLRKGDIYIVSEMIRDAKVKTSMTPFLRDGGSDTVGFLDGKRSSFVDDFERLYDELLKQNAEACGESSPTPCTEAWMKLASLLQMRNSYLEHQVQELQDTNDSLNEDVLWHVEALDELEEQLREAWFEVAAASADVLDLKIQLACAKRRDASSAPELGDEMSTYTGMTSSGPSEPSAGYNTDIGVEMTYGSQQRDGPACQDTVQDACRLVAVHRESKAETRVRADAFYFFPRTSLILLMSSPSRSYKWPQGTTLPQIYRDLIRRYNEDVKNDPVFDIMDILDLRDDYGIWLPDPVSDEVIKVSVPDLDEISEFGHDILLAAWETVDMGPSWDEQDWDDWWGDVVQLNPCSLVSYAYSDGERCRDANELFGDWSWGIDASGEPDGLSKREPFVEAHNHVDCSFRGGTGNELDEPGVVADRGRTMS